MMKRVSLAGVLTACLAAVVHMGAVAELNVERMATCQDSWLDWKDDPVQAKQFAESFNAGFRQKQGDPFFVPKTSAFVAGLPVVQVFPDSVGMGVGFSVTVNAPFDKSRAAIEKTIGKSLKDCETSDGMRTCGLEISEKKTIVLMADSTGKIKTTLVGCYYYYAK